MLSLEEQATRAYAEYQSQPDDEAKNVYMAALQDRNEVLFYRLMAEHLKEMLPVVYHPTVGKLAIYSAEGPGTQVVRTAIREAAM